jgi:SAM-dependent methyltransferase
LKEDRKKVSRDIGLEIGSICGMYFLKLKHLHYGYWTDDLKVDISNVHIAQDNYTDLLISRIPDSADRILDVGCGNGYTAARLVELGFHVDCVSPNHYLASHARQLLGNACTVFTCLYEQLQTDNRYDVILFSESFQYIDMRHALDKTIRLLTPAGCMLICDFFKKNTSAKSTISGGHPLNMFYDIVSEYPLTLVEDLDITDATAPTMDVLEDAFSNAVHPTVLLTQQILQNRYPLLSRVAKTFFRKRIAKINRKYFSGSRTGQAFRTFKSYRLLLYRNAAAD